MPKNFKEFLNEYTVDKPVDVWAKEIAELTDINNHNEALLALAQLLGDKKKEKEINAIIKQHLKIGHMSPELKDKIDPIYDYLFKKARKQLTKDEFKKIHGAF